MSCANMTTSITEAVKWCILRKLCFMYYSLHPHPLQTDLAFAIYTANKKICHSGRCQGGKAVCISRFMRHLEHARRFLISLGI